MSGRHTCGITKPLPPMVKLIILHECVACRAQDGIKCSCPDGWFPAERAFHLRQLPHGYGGGMMAHHVSCAKAKA
jgi:hypothetical protein